MEVTRLTKQNHYEAIMEQIKQQIVDGTLKPGDKLPSTRELSERFGVGRSTTREALSALKAMGYIDIRQGGGCVVLQSAPPGEQPLAELQVQSTELLNLLEARKALEVANAALAAEKRTEQDCRVLERLLKEMKSSIGDDLEGERTDLEFHLSLARMTHNPIMVQLLESIMLPMEQAIRGVRRAELYSNRSVAVKLYREHEEIRMAVQRGDKDLAARSMSVHLQHVEEIVLKYV
ncbi:FadR/GntR family transcriptional regulator [Paenibacillus gansuensis]|uniref:FadR/GntR family transcriptional regulator n=1 Tax=Paenibacillus gansuensis TaxID=306542 RepID=A0ABW5PDH3_9BACL